MFGLSKIAKSVTGIAKTVSGSVTNFRSVLDANPGTLGLLLPPQVQMGFKIANAVGLKIPSPDELAGKVLSEVGKVTLGAYRPTTEDIKRAINGDFKGLTPDIRKAVELLKSQGSPFLEKVQLGQIAIQDALNSIDWLL